MTVSSLNFDLPLYFVNREFELALLAEFWNSRESIISVTGMGGVGKTALVREFVRQLELQVGRTAPSFVIGWSFDANRNVIALLTTICRTLGDDPPPETPLTILKEKAQTLLSAHGRGLLILDGVESTTPSEFEDLIATLMRSPAEYKIVMTSRIYVPSFGRTISLGGFNIEAGTQLLLSHGVRRSSEQLRRVTSALQGYPLALVLLAGMLREGSLEDSEELLDSISRGRFHAESVLPTLVHRVDESLSELERASLARISLFEGGISVNDFDALIVHAEEPLVSGPLAGLPIQRTIELVDGLRSRGLINFRDDGSCHVHPIFRDYFLQAIPDRGPLHQHVADELIQLLESRDSTISRDTSDVILEIVYQLTASKHMSPTQIKRLAGLLPKKPDDRTLRAYDSVLDAALRLASTPQAQSSSPPPPLQRAFISYLRDDVDKVTELRQALEQHHIDVWQDTDRLVPGRRWKAEIRNAIKAGDFFIACFSESYAKKGRTYMREEILIAIEELRLRPVDRSWFVSVLLAPVEVPDLSIGGVETLRDLHWVDLSRDWDKGITSLFKALR